MSDDIIRRLREAIAAGPTPGPWFHAYDFGQIGSVENEAGHVILQAQQTAPGREDVDRRNKTAAYIAAASPDNIAALLDRLDKAERERERLGLFTGNVLEKSRDEFLEMSCADIEDWAKQCGLLEQVEMTAACGDDCKCAEWADFPLECLRPTALGSAAIDAARAAEKGKE